MESSQIILHNTKLEYALGRLYDQVKQIGGEVIEYTKTVEYLDGTRKDVTFRHILQPVGPPKNNQLVVNAIRTIETEPGKVSEVETIREIVFEIKPVQINTVVIEAEFIPLQTGYVERLWSHLNLVFEQGITPQAQNSESDAGFNALPNSLADTSAVQVQEPPKPPSPKEHGGKIGLWLDWYHAMHRSGFKCTLEDVANRSGYSVGYIKQKNMAYLAKPNQRSN